MMYHNISGFESHVASLSASRFGVTPLMPFSSLADPEASSVADLLKSIPGVSYTSHGGVILPDSASELGELCGEFLNGVCTKRSCDLIHPPFLLLAGAVYSLMTRYCQPKAQPQPSPDLAAGERRTQSHQEKIKKLYGLFVNNRKVRYGPVDCEIVTTDEAFVRHCSKEWVQQLCDRPGNCGYMYFEAADIYGRKRRLEPFHELAEDVINKYNLEKKENLEVKKVLKANWMTMFFYMTIEVWDNKTNRDRIFQAGVWVKGSRNFVVGYFKDVTDCSVSNVS